MPLAMLKLGLIIPIIVTLVGIVTDVTAVDQLKAPKPMVVTLVGILKLVMGQAPYWYIVIVVVVVGMVIAVKRLNV